jgi:hypothetical protein
LIPRDYTTAWRKNAPWVQDIQVEQDLVICRALVERILDMELSPRARQLSADQLGELLQFLVSFWRVCRDV